MNHRFVTSLILLGVFSATPQLIGGTESHRTPLAVALAMTLSTQSPTDGTDRIAESGADAATTHAESPPSGPSLPKQGLRFLGRLHPVFVHFPVALLIAAALFEWIGMRRRERPAETAKACLTLAALFAVAAAGSGWLNGALEAHNRTVERAIEVHRWSGISSAVLAWGALLLAWSCRGGKGPLIAYRYLLFGAALAVGFTGHVGGTIVYGDNYQLLAFEAVKRASRTPRPPPPPAEVTDSVPSPATSTDDTPDGPSDDAPVAAPLTDAAPPSEAVDFERHVAPIFAEYCYECHGPDKQEGRLALHEKQGLFGENPALWSVIPGSAERSILMELIELPPDDPDFMPQDGTPLSKEQIDVIRDWIDQGATWPD